MADMQHDDGPNITNEFIFHTIKLRGMVKIQGRFAQYNFLLEEISEIHDHNCCPFNVMSCVDDQQEIEP